MVEKLIKLPESINMINSICANSIYDQSVGDILIEWLMPPDLSLASSHIGMKRFFYNKPYMFTLTFLLRVTSKDLNFIISQTCEVFYSHNAVDHPVIQISPLAGKWTWGVELLEHNEIACAQCCIRKFGSGYSLLLRSQVKGKVTAVLQTLLYDGIEKEVTRNKLRFGCVH